MKTHPLAISAVAVLLIVSESCSKPENPTTHTNSAKLSRRPTKEMDPDVVEAVEKGHVVTLKALLNTGLVDTNAVDASGNSLLLVALRRGSSNDLRERRVVELLLDSGADPNLELPGGGTALLEAAKRASPETVGLLIKRGARVNQAWNGESPLIAALDSSNALAAVVLIENGADLSVKAKDGLTPLMMAVSGRHKKAVVQALLEKGVDVNTRGPNGVTALMTSVYSGGMDVAPDPEVVDLLIGKGADVNAKSSDGTTALMMACHIPFQNLAQTIVKNLLAHGADPNAVNASGLTAAIVAARNPYSPYLRQLLPVNSSSE